MLPHEWIDNFSYFPKKKTYGKYTCNHMQFLSENLFISLFVSQKNALNGEKNNSDSLNSAVFKRSSALETEAWTTYLGYQKTLPFFYHREKWTKLPLDEYALKGFFSPYIPQPRRDSPKSKCHNGQSRLLSQTFCRIQGIAIPARGIASIKFTTLRSTRDVEIRQSYNIVL